MTFFFNGGVEAPNPGEDRCLIPSPKVATYDLQPEMSAYEVTEEAVKRIDSGKYDVMILNFANPDMVGHTGVMEAAVKAVHTVDECAAKVVEAILRNGGRAIITADHGNCEKMLADDGITPFTAHTTNPVPVILVDNGRKERKAPLRRQALRPCPHHAGPDGHGDTQGNDRQEPYREVMRQKGRPF